MYHIPPKKKKREKGERSRLSAPSQAAHSSKMRGNKKQECPSNVTRDPVKVGQHGGRFSLFWSRKTRTVRHNTFQPYSSLWATVCEEGCSTNTELTHSRALPTVDWTDWSKEGWRERARVCQVTRRSDRCQRQPLCEQLLRVTGHSKYTAMKYVRKKIAAFFPRNSDFIILFIYFNQSHNSLFSWIFFLF